MMKRKKKKKQPLVSLFTLLSLVILIWLISTLLVWKMFSDWSKSGSFGDTFGAINSLFSGLALAGIIYTIYLQKTELGLQRKELKYTRKELKRSANAQEITTKLLTEQIRINNIPFLEYKSVNLNKSEYLLIKNLSDNHAFDIDIGLYIMVSNSEYPLNEFVNEQVREDDLSLINIKELIDDEFYCIYERSVYQTFPKNQKIEVPIVFPVDVNYFHLFIQYRDSLGNNYSQNIFFGNINDSEKTYSQVSTEPIFPKVTPRVDWGQPIDKKSLPKFINNILSFKKSEIYVSRLKHKEYQGSEDNWEMNDV